MTHTPARALKFTKDSAGLPAVDLTKVRDDGHIDLAKKADKVGLALSQAGLAGSRAQAVLVLDHSGSMRNDYASGAVQILVERALGFALQIDADGVVPVIPFDGRVWPTIYVGVDDTATSKTYHKVVDLHIWQRHAMGTTDLAGALRSLRQLVETSTEPVFAIIVTDGEPDDAGAATKVICDLARYPVFVKFAAIRPVQYLSELDNLDNRVRLLDNVNAQPPVGSSLDLLTCSDLDFAKAMVDEWSEWIGRAKAAGILQ